MAGRAHRYAVAPHAAHAGDSIVRYPAVSRRGGLGDAGCAEQWAAQPGLPRPDRRQSDDYLFNIYSLPGLIFVISCYTFPYVFVLVANALDRMPGDLEDASSILGADAWTTARRVTIPLAMPALLAGALVAFLQAMTLFGSPAILALPAGFHTMTTKIWSLFQYPPKLELAAAASLPLLLLTVLLLRGRSLFPRPARLCTGRRPAERSAAGRAGGVEMGGARRSLPGAAQSGFFAIRGAA